MNIKENFERVGFTPEEKMDLAARLERAAEQEDNMTNATKRKIKKISGGMVFGIAAAVIMTAGALAAVVSSKLRDWFNPVSTGASQVLEDGIYRLDRSETYNGWTVTLEECVGDDSNVYIWVDLAAPEGTKLVPPADGYFYLDYMLEHPDCGSGRRLYPLQDEDPEDNHLTFLIQHDFSWKSLQGETVDIKFDPLIDVWCEEGATPGETVFHHEGTELTAAVRDHKWIFEDVKLDFPDQTIRMETGVEIPWLEGTTTLTSLEVSPFNVTVRVEGGSCSTYVDRAFETDTFNEVDSIEVGGIVIGMGTTGEEEGPSQLDMMKALTVDLTLEDGTVLSLERCFDGGSGWAEGIEGPETPFLKLVQRCADYDAVRIWDPAQVDHVTVCGVDIPVNPAPAKD